MNDIIIPEITITQSDLVNSILLYLACLAVVSVISKKRVWLKNTLWSMRTVYWLLGTLSVAVFLPSLWEAIKLFTGHSNLLGKNLRSYAVLFATIVGPAFIFWRVYAAQQQSNLPDQNSILDRIAKAMKDLGVDENGKPDINNASRPNLKSRLDAIYSFERIAQDNLGRHVQVMEILCAYIRNNSEAGLAILVPDETKPDLAKWKESIPTAETDIQAAIDVITRRSKEQILKEVEADFTLDLRNCNLQRIDFKSGRFERVQMDNCHLDFAKMTNTDFGGAELNRATLNGADLSEAKLNDVTLNGAKLNGANLVRAELNSAKLNGRGTQQCDVEPCKA